MLNRRHIRVKVLQALYAYWSADGEINKLHIERDMEKNMYRLYELYLYLLIFLKELTLFVERYDDEVKARFIPQESQINVNQKFYTNELIAKVLDSKVLEAEANQYKVNWETENMDLVRKVFLDLKNSEVYKEYLADEKKDVLRDLEILSFIVKHYPFSFFLMEQQLEDKFINWYDDGKVAVQMVIKTLKKVASDPDTDDILVPIATDKELSFDFSYKLFNICIEHNQDFEELIISKIDKWEPSRVPLIDLIILKMGLCEFLYFNSIPVKVTINECIELAKTYSTPNSKKFINGVLDNLLAELNRSNKINKSGLGLADG